MKDIGEFLSIIAQIAAYILGLILIVQIVRLILGGSWEIEDVILAIVIFNLTITFGIGGYLIHLHNIISRVDKKLHGHIEWHRGSEDKR